MISGCNRNGLFRVVNDGELAIGAIGKVVKTLPLDCTGIRPKRVATTSLNDLPCNSS